MSIARQLHDRESPENQHGADQPPTPLLALRSATKTFAGVHALTDVSLDLYGGEVHALVGENGAGKSTLVKILGGIHQPDAGALLSRGREVTLLGPADAQALGIAVIYQEPTLFPDLTVAENVFIGRQPLRFGRRIDRRKMDRSVLTLFERLGVKLDPDRVARGLSIAEQQLVEIAKALSLDANVLIMDEPTAALSPFEADRLFRVVETLRGEGAAVLLISHRLEEVFATCQRVTVLRDGSYVMSDRLQGLRPDDLVRAMVGRDVAPASRRPHARGAALLEVEGLSREGVFDDISFKVHAGEIVAIAGLVGAGRTEVARAIFGVDPYDAGTVQVGGQTLKAASPPAAMNAGIGFVPEDRRQQGLVMEMPTGANIALASRTRLTQHGLLLARVERAFATRWAERLRVKYSSLSASVSNLSGGNQQKVVLAKWLALKPSVLIVDEPTRGIDVGTKAEVHRLLDSLAADGVGVLVISSELTEVLELADRILVMREGLLAATIERAAASEERIIAAATGQPAHAAGEGDQ
jgi:rhamnose transport system ATP-binding protein